jgi:hypothetical protein
MDWSRPDDPTRPESFEADPLCCSANSANSPVPVPKPVSTPLPVQTKPMSCNSTIYNTDYTWLWSTINGMMQLPLSRSPTEQSSFGQQTKACLVPVLAHGTDRFSALAASLAKFTSKVRTKIALTFIILPGLPSTPSRHLDVGISSNRKCPCNGDMSKPTSYS